MAYRIINSNFNWNKYKGLPIKEVIEKDLSYFQFCVDKGYDIDGSVLDFVDSKIKEFNSFRLFLIEKLKNKNLESIKKENNIKKPYIEDNSRDLSKDFYAPRYSDEDLLY